MEFKDYYTTLGVSRNADQDEIRKAYRRLARKHHPDVNKDPDAAEQFKAINEAYQVLSDPEKRQRYDRFGKDWEQYQSTTNVDDSQFADWVRRQGTGPQGQRVNYEFFTSDSSNRAGFSDFFDLLFGQDPGFGGGPDVEFTRQGFSGARTAAPQRGEDHEYPIELSLDDAFRGTTRTFQLQRSNGSGAGPTTSTIEVTIPPGVKDGSRVRVSGKGGPGRHGGPPGDVYLKVRVKPHPMFKLEGTKLRAKLPVPLYTAILGGEAPLDLPGGRRIMVNIPPETQTGKLIRLRGQGWPKKVRGDERDDLLVEVQVMIPTDLTDEERELFERLAALRDREAAKV
ncbi:MAG: DnaJ C-terminal domain-containing protein [Chloroflexota bacterium]